MHILVTNDDGIFAPGLAALANAMTALGDVTVLAPDRNWSASGHVKTLHKPLRIKPVKFAGGIAAFASDGAPSDCVALALLGAVEPKVDLVVSGINPNANIGHDVTYSGTVTAAMEGAIAGIPAIAVSLDSPENFLEELDYSTAAQAARRVAQQVIARGLQKGIVLNVNVPYRTAAELSGYIITRQGLRIYRDQLVQRVDPRGRPYYWIGGEVPSGVVEDGTDYGALAAGYVSITPLQLDLTAFSMLETLKEWQWV